MEEIMSNYYLEQDMAALERELGNSDYDNTGKDNQQKKHNPKKDNSVNAEKRKEAKEKAQQRDEERKYAHANDYSSLQAERPQSSVLQKKDVQSGKKPFNKDNSQSSDRPTFKKGNRQGSEKKVVDFHQNGRAKGSHYRSNKDYRGERNAKQSWYR